MTTSCNHCKQQFWHSFKKERYSLLRITIFGSVTSVVMRLGCWHIYGISVIGQNWTLSRFQTQMRLASSQDDLFFTLQSAISPCQLFNFCLNSPAVCHRNQPQCSKAGKVTWKSVHDAIVVKCQYLELAYWWYLTERDSSLLLPHCFDSLPLYTLLPLYSFENHLSLSITDTLFYAAKALRPCFFSVWK